MNDTEKKYKKNNGHRNVALPEKIAEKSDRNLLYLEQEDELPEKYYDIM